MDEPDGSSSSSKASHPRPYRNNRIEWVRRKALSDNLNKKAVRTYTDSESWGNPMANTEMNATTPLPTWLEPTSQYPEIRAALEEAKNCYRYPTGWCARGDHDAFQWMMGDSESPHTAETIRRLTAEMLKLEAEKVIPAAEAVCKEWGVTLLTREQILREEHCALGGYMRSPAHITDMEFAWITFSGDDYWVSGISAKQDGGLSRRLCITKPARAEIASELSRSYRRGRIDFMEMAAILKLSNELNGGSLDAIKPWRDQDGGTCLKSDAKVWLLPPGQQHERWLVHVGGNGDNPYVERVPVKVRAYKQAHREDNGPGWQYTTEHAEVMEGPYAGAGLGKITVGMHFETRLGDKDGKIIGYGIEVPWEKVASPSQPRAPYGHGEVCNMSRPPGSGPSTSSNGEMWEGEAALLLFPAPFPADKVQPLPTLTEEEANAILDAAGYE